MNVIDALVITLGLDPKGFEKGRKDVDSGMKDLREKSAKTAKEMEEQGKKAAAFFSSVKVELLGLLAAFGAASGLKEFIGTSVTGQAALGRMSANLGIATQRLQAYQTVMEGVGGSATDANEALNNIAKGVANAAIGHTEFFQSAAANGIAINAGMSYEQILGKIGARMRELNAHGAQGRQQALLLSQQLGVGGMAQALLLPNFDQMVAQAEALAQRTAKSTAEAQKLQMQWALLKERFQGVSDKVFAEMEPKLEKLGNQLANFLDSVNWDKVITKAEAWLGVVKQLVDAFGGIKGILIEIAAYKALTFFGNIAVSLARIAALTKAMRGLKVAAAEASGAEAAAASGGAVPPGAGAAGGFLAKLGGWGALLRGFFFAPKPADDRPILDQLSPDQAAKFKADAQKSWLHRWADFLGSGSSDVASSPIAVATRKHMATRADDNIDLFGGRYSGKVSTAQLLSSLEKKNGLPAGLLSGVLAAESNNNDPRYQRSAKGALGPFQFEPATASDYGLTGKDVFDFNKSANAAARYLHDLIAMFHGNVPMAVAAYNWGMGNVQNKGMGHLPAETRDYLNKVLGGVRVGAATVAMAKQPSSTTTSTRTTQTHIGQINVNAPKAVDANGIARDMRQAIADNDLVAQADTGLN